jgi:ATP-dependent Zn protease
MKADKTRQATAYHEAGHVVAAWRSGAKGIVATIVADGETYGRVKHRQTLRRDWQWTSSARNSRQIDGRIITLLAGAAAERRFRGRATGTSRDYRLAVDIAMSACGSDDQVNAYLRYLSICARDLVDAFWPAVEAIALALLERETLNHDEICGAIMSAKR